MSKNLVSLIATIVLAVATVVWASDSNRPNAMPSAAGASTGIDILQLTRDAGVLPVEQYGAI